MPAKNNHKEKNGGIQQRMGEKFHKEVEDIKDERLRNGKSKNRLATTKITNLIAKHKLWKDIKANLIEASEEEVEQYG